MSDPHRYLQHAPDSPQGDAARGAENLENPGRRWFMGGAIATAASLALKTTAEAETELVRIARKISRPIGKIPFGKAAKGLEAFPFSEECQSAFNGKPLLIRRTNMPAPRYFAGSNVDAENAQLFKIPISCKGTLPGTAIEVDLCGPFGAEDIGDAMRMASADFGYLRKQAEAGKYRNTPYEKAIAEESEQVEVDPRVWGLLCKIAMKFGVDKEIMVNSFFRCPAYNLSLEGAASNSYHMSGVAIDLNVPGVKREDLYTWLRSEGFAAGFYGGFIHVDLGPDHRFWCQDSFIPIGKDANGQYVFGCSKEALKDPAKAVAERQANKTGFFQFIAAENAARKLNGLPALSADDYFKKKRDIEEYEKRNIPSINLEPVENIIANVFDLFSGGSSKSSATGTKTMTGSVSKGKAAKAASSDFPNPFDTFGR